MTFGERLKIAMDFRGKKAIDVAENIGMAKSNVSRYMNDKLPEPKQSTIFKFADYLQVNRAFLLGLSSNIVVWDIEKGERENETESELILADINNICSKQDLDTLKSIYSVIKALAK